VIRSLDGRGVAKAGGAGGCPEATPAVAALISEHLNSAIGLKLELLRGNEIRGQAAVDMHERQQRGGGLAAQFDPAADAQVHGGEATNDDCLDAVRQSEPAADLQR
jgi:hypothetical protein